MNTAARIAIGIALAAFAAVVTHGLVLWWTTSAASRLAEIEAVVVEDPASQVAVATAADDEYCSPKLKRVLRRVLTSCGLASDGEVRGCQPLEAKSVATLSGNDFNALFLPLEERAGIIQFESGDSDIDAEGRKLLGEVFADQGGASYFFVVARASPDGAREFNQKISQERGEAVLEVLREDFDDPDLDKEVGLLWLGEEFAQLDETFCDWSRSHDDEECRTTQLNRSAFVAWIDCRL